MYWVDLPIVRYVSAPGSKLSNKECMGNYANSWYNRYLKINFPDPDEWMETHYKNKCVRLEINDTAINNCIINSNFAKSNNLN